jgi:hypothetical protein
MRTEMAIRASTPLTIVGERGRDPLDDMMIAGWTHLTIFRPIAP